MHDQDNELRDELVAILSAGRELPADTDMQLADAFLRSLELHQERETADVALREVPHQPHYSLKVAGGAWGAALMLLFLLLVLEHPDNPLLFILLSVALLSLIAAGTRGFLYLARYGWQLPDVRIRVTPPARKPQIRRQGVGRREASALLGPAHCAGERSGAVNRQRR